MAELCWLALDELDDRAPLPQPECMQHAHAAAALTPTDIRIPLCITPASASSSSDGCAVSCGSEFWMCSRLQEQHHQALMSWQHPDAPLESGVRSALLSSGAAGDELHRPTAFLQVCPVPLANATINSCRLQTTSVDRWQIFCGGGRDNVPSLSPLASEKSAR